MRYVWLKMEWIEIEEMKSRDLVKIRNKFFRDPSQNNQSFLIYAYLVVYLKESFPAKQGRIF